MKKKISSIALILLFSAFSILACSAGDNSSDDECEYPDSDDETPDVNDDETNDDLDDDLDDDLNDDSNDDSSDDDLGGDEFQISGDFQGSQAHPAVAMNSSGEFIVAWESEDDQDGQWAGIFARKYDSTGTPLSDEFQVNTEFLGNQTSPTVGIDDEGNFIIAWEGGFYNSDGDEYGIMAKRYLSNASPIGDEFVVNTIWESSQTDPVLSMTGEGMFIVIWLSYVEYDDRFHHDLHGQLFRANGSRIGSEFSIAEDLTYSLVTSVSFNSNKDFIACWEEPIDINFCQFFNGTGNPQGDAFYIVEEEWPHYTKPAINNNGDSILVYQDDRPGSWSNSIFAQISYDAENNFWDPFIVNDYPVDDNFVPSVALNDSGDFIVAWMTDRIDTEDEIGIFAKKMNIDDLTSGSEFHVNSYTFGVQARPVVGIDANGGFVVVWQSKGQDGYGEGIFGKLYATNG